MRYESISSGVEAIKAIIRVSKNETQKGISNGICLGVAQTMHKKPEFR